MMTYIYKTVIFEFSTYNNPHINFKLLFKHLQFELQPQTSGPITVQHFNDVIRF